MPISDVEKIYSITFPHYKRVTIVWHGGEPTCAGIEFYREAFKLEKKYASTYGVTVRNAMQTNGTQITPEFIELFKEYKVDVGISYDGIVNDITRNSTQKVNECRTLFQKNGMDPGLITVVTALNIDRLIENYNVMKKEKRNIQLNHYVEVSKEAPMVQLQMDYDHYIVRMEEFFDYWVNDESCNIDVEPFTQLFFEYLLNCPTVCTRSSCHRNWMSIDKDGNVAPCDKMFPAKYRFGNIHQMNDIREVYESEGFRLLLEGVIIRRRKCIEKCDVYNYCEGGCSHSALVETGIENIGGFSCRSQKALIKKVISFCEDNGVNLDNLKEKIPNKFLVGKIEAKHHAQCERT